jgi:hypothetical protein
VTDSFASDTSQLFTREIDTAGELPLATRRRLKEDLIGRLPGDGNALRFIAALGLTCAKQVWPVWRTAFPAEFRPMRLAEAVVSSVNQRNVSAVSAEEEFSSVKTDLDNKLLLGPAYFRAIFAGFACWAVARDVLTWNSRLVVQGDNELQVSPEDWDPCFFASLAKTGKAVWEGNEESGVRREFWTWYLTSAIPDAFTAALDQSTSEERRREPEWQDPLF